MGLNNDMPIFRYKNTKTLWDLVSVYQPTHTKESNQVSVLPSNLKILLEKENLLPCHIVLALCTRLWRRSDILKCY